MKTLLMLLTILFTIILPSSLFALTETTTDSNQCSSAYSIATLDGANANISSTTKYYKNNWSNNKNIYLEFTPLQSGEVTISEGEHPWGNSGKVKFYIGTTCGGNTVVNSDSNSKNHGPFTFNVNAGATYYVYLRKKDKDYLRYSLSFSFTLQATSQVDLKLSDKTSPSPDPVDIGENVTFKVRSNNLGPDTAKKNIVLKVKYNQDITITSTSYDSGGDFSCDKSSGTLVAGDFITCTKNSNWRNTTNNKDFTFIVQPSISGTLTQTATIESTTSNDSDQGNNTLVSSVTVNAITYIENADDICSQEDENSKLCILNCKKTIFLKSIHDITNVEATINTTGLSGSFVNDCGVNGTSGKNKNSGENGYCSNKSTINAGPFSFLDKGVYFNVAQTIPSDTNNSIYDEAFMQMSFFSTDKLYATYKKGGQYYRGKVKSCADLIPPDAPGDETLPSAILEPETPVCGAFEDVLQTRESQSKIKNKSGASADIYNSPDCSLNTSLVDFGQYQSLSCDGGDANATGINSQSVTVNYSNQPTLSTIDTTPSSSSNDVTLTADTRLQEFNYNNIATDDHTGLTIDFNVTNQLKINSLKMTTDNIFNFASDSLYSLDIGTIGIKSNGARNSFNTDNNAKNIKISTFNLPGSTSVDFSAAQTIKMTSMTVGRASQITLKAPYVEIGTLHQSNSGSGNSVVTIMADYVDMQTLDLDQQSTIIFKPYTSGQRILFRANTISASSSSTMIVDSGNYYVESFDIPGSNNVSSIHASDANQLINFYIDGDFKPGNSPGINSDGNSGNFGTLPPSNFLFFVNGDLQTGGGGTTFNATVYVEGTSDFGSPTYIKGALSSSGTITIGNGSKFYYDQNMSDSGWGECQAITTYGCSKPHAFELRKNLVITGDLIAIGNSNICADNDGNRICDTNQKKRNDTSTIIEVNSTSSSAVSGEPISLHNRSAANLSLPAGASVVWAGLYWQGEVWDINTDHTSRVGGSGKAIENGEDGQARKALANTIKFKVPGGSYVDLSADEHYYFFVQVGSNKNSDYKGVANRYEEHYQSFKDVTDLVSNAGEGDYWVGNIQATVGKLWYPGVESAWSLQVIYNDPNGEPRSISVTDGYVGLYDNGSVGDKYANTINGINGNSECLTGGANTGAYNNEVSFNVGGFLTPSSSGFQTDMSIFITESDPDGNNRPEEQLTITKKDGSISQIDGPGAWNYEITLKDGVTNNDARTPNYIYPIGMTIKNYHQTDILSTEQTSTTVTFKTGPDRLMLGVIGFATDLRKPKLCYDYSYSQYDTFFTEDNNGSRSPKVTGTVSTTEPIEMQLYVKNMENSDVLAKAIHMSVEDINISQAKYISGTTRLSEPGSVLANSVPESDIDSSPSYIRDINVGDLDSLQYFYTYYKLDPQQSAIDMPIHARVDYNITLPLDNSGNTITIPYEVYLNSDIPLCSSTDFRYTPQYGIFNVVDNNYYDSTSQGSSPKYYNLPTQVTLREGNFKVIALDETNQDDLHGVSTTVAVELIATEGFHITEAQCQDPSKSISDRVWVTFDNNATSAMFDKTALQNAIADGMTDLTSTTDFYKKARQNAAFRISYNLSTDGNNSLVQTERQNDGTYKILNFSGVVQTVGACQQPVEYPVGNHTGIANRVAQACGNAGHGISKAQLKSCMECVYGYNTKYVCSRDNFSIRPEALSVKVYDDNESTLPKLEIDSTISDVITPSSNSLDLAAGYSYVIDVNATNHLNNDPSPGYTKTIDPTTETGMYIWEPRNTHIITGCNETNNSNLDLTFFNGKASSRKTLSQVGEYRLSIEDKTWTSVDNNPLYMTHHTGTHFTQTSDCIKDSSITQVVNVSAGSSTPLIGCNISSSHDNSFNAPTNNLKYRDYNITFHPYTFDVANIVPSIGLNNASVTGTSFIYMADLSQLQGENMSYHLNGTISAVGKDNVVLSNFVDKCYAEPLNISLSKSTIALPVAYQYKFHTYEANSTEIGTSSVVDLNNSNFPIVVNTKSFPKDLNGSVDTLLNLNYNRTKDNAVNPQKVTFNNYSVDCSIQSDCAYSANEVNNETPQGVLELNHDVKHYYGRTNTPRQKFIDSTTATNHDAFIYYEIYCDISDGNKTLLPNGNASTFNDDPRWYINTQHTSTDGTASNILEKRLSGDITTVTEPTGSHPDKMTVKYTGGSYPYITTMENNASSWLIYDKYNASADRNEFVLEFYKNAGGYVGSGKSTSDINTTTQGVVSGTTNINENKSWW